MLLKRMVIGLALILGVAIYALYGQKPRTTSYEEAQMLGHQGTVVENTSYISSNQ